jgi:hypothetical protein
MRNVWIGQKVTGTLEMIPLARQQWWQRMQFETNQVCKAEANCLIWYVERGSMPYKWLQVPTGTGWRERPNS